MIKRNQRLLNSLNVISDAALILLAYFAAMSIRFTLLHGTATLAQTQGMFFNMALADSVLIVTGYYIAGLYGSFRLRRIGTENWKILLVNAVGTLLLVAMLYLMRVVDFSRWSLALYWAIASLFVILKRLAVRGLLHYIRARSYNQKHFAIVGNGRLAAQFVEDIRSQPELGITIDGYFSAVQREGLGECLGSYEQIGAVLERRSFDSLVVALEPHEVRFMQHVLDAADKEGVRVELIPFYNNYMPAHPVIESVGATKLIDLRATPLDKAGWAIVKRLMDIVGALLAIVLLSPVMLFAAVGVKLSSPGPVFFRQERVGRDKKPFMMLKFRSMRTDVDHTGWSTQSDDRKTRFGSLIRKCSIDELPQFFNVLLGQMSLVGPRPEIPRYVREFKEDVPLYLVRQQVRPGITGWAQIHGLRGDTSIEDRVVYDIWYIENWTVGLDVRILIRTVLGGFMNEEKLVPEQKTPAEKEQTHV